MRCRPLGVKARHLPTTQCLILLDTAGDRPEWNFRRGSESHQAVPLIDKDFVRGIPMISQLIQQFGLDICTALENSPTMRSKFFL